jgi:hypothetical protein
LTVEDDIKKTTNEIIEVFKLGSELKSEYPDILKRILDLEKDKDFFVAHFTK